MSKKGPLTYPINLLCNPCSFQTQINFVTDEHGSYDGGIFLSSVNYHYNFLTITTIIDGKCQFVTGAIPSNTTMCSQSSSQKENQSRRGNTLKKMKIKFWTRMRMMKLGS